MMKDWFKYLGNSYELLDTLKEDVLLFYDRRSKELCVFKRHPHTSPALYRTLKNVTSRHIPLIFRLFELEDCCLVLEEYIVGQTLAERLANGQSPPDNSISDILRQICKGLLPLHDRGLIHRDINPNNITQTRDGVIKLIDFGIARQIKDEQGKDTVCLGTRGYAPPEQYGFG